MPSELAQLSISLLIRPDVMDLNPKVGFDGVLCCIQAY